MGKRSNLPILVLLAVALLGGLALAGHEWLLFGRPPADWFEFAAQALGAAMGVFVEVLFPIGYLILGLRKLRAQRRAAEALDAAHPAPDPDGERKTRELIDAVTSTEARIGLLQRSDTTARS